MTTRQTIYASAVFVLGNIQMFPCLAILSSTTIAVLFGTVYALGLAFFWSSTRKGRWFFVEFYRSTLRLESLILGRGC